MSKCSSDSISAACAAVGWKDGVLDSIICSKPLSKIPKKWGPSSEHCKRGCTTCQAAQSHLCARAGAARHLFHFPKLKTITSTGTFQLQQNPPGWDGQGTGGRQEVWWLLFFSVDVSLHSWMFFSTRVSWCVAHPAHKAHEDTSYRITHCFLLMSSSCPSMPTLPQSSS